MRLLRPWRCVCTAEGGGKSLICPFLRSDSAASRCRSLLQGNGRNDVDLTFVSRGQGSIPSLTQEAATARILQPLMAVSWRNHGSEEMPRRDMVKVDGASVKHFRCRYATSQKRFIELRGRNYEVSLRTLERAERSRELSVPMVMALARSLDVSVRVIAPDLRGSMPDGGVISKTHLIRSLAGDYKPLKSESVQGHTLHYLETGSGANDVIVCLHGLGLDAQDFKPFLLHTDRNAVAVTLCGFNQHEASSKDHTPLRRQTHAYALLSFLEQELLKRPHVRRIHFVGFSLGADLLLVLAEILSALKLELPIGSVLFLDCNVNRRTMTICKKIATCNPSRPIMVFKDIVNEVDTLDEFRHYTDYLRRISLKSLKRVKHFAKQFLAYWPEYSDTVQFSEFRSRARLVGLHALDPLFILSSDNATLGRELLSILTPEEAEMVVLSQQSHFELLDPSFIEDHLTERLQHNAWAR